MIISMGELLKKAKKEGYGVAAPNVFDSLSVKACFETADKIKAPVILDCAGLPFLEEVAELSRFYERKYPNVPAALNLDHGGPYEEFVCAIKYGFSSVMIDRSTLPYKENAREVKEVVKMAYVAGVSVEAELRHVGQGFEYESTRDGGLTDPKEALKFVHETGIDCLAVAVETGIQKVNLFTDLCTAGVQKMCAFLGIDWNSMMEGKGNSELANMKANMCDAGLAAKEGYAEALEHYMKLFGGEGRA